MQVRRSAAIVGGVALVGAWLASAAGLIYSEPEPAPAQARASATSGAASLDEDVRAQAARLRDRLNRAPNPQPAGRNPFRFESRRPIVDRDARPRPAIVDVPPAPLATPLPIKLEGLAERGGDGAKKRIAILSIYTEIFLVAEGELLNGRFRVKSIGTDVVELEEVATGTLTRLAIR
ncbi:MAG: hypothetical protein ACRD1S_06745 [Vicinamibacterales bacterium]